jgi:RNA polymerase sigma factor (sigma-70 family)
LSSYPVNCSTPFDECRRTTNGFHPIFRSHLVRQGLTVGENYFDPGLGAFAGPLVYMRVVMEELTRYQWIADHILPWEPEVRRWLSRRTYSLSPDDIDDLIQEAYVRIWSADFRSIQNGRAFLYAVARNSLRDQFRRAQVVQMECVAELDALDIEEAPGPERMVSARQQYEQLVDIVNDLPRQRRAVFSARKFEGLSIREIAKRLGLSEKTVANHLRLALAQVTQSMFGERDIVGQTSERNIRERTRKRD